MADYNINAVTRRVVYTGSAGVGPYAFTFEILDDDDLAVYFNSTKLTKTTDYNVTINANGTGSVTLVVNVGGNVPQTPVASDGVIVVGARDIERTTDFVTAGDLLASSLNEQLDSLTIFDQQIAEEEKRTLQAPVYDPAHVDEGGTLDMTLPAKADRAGKYLAFNNSTGNPEVGPTVSDVTTVSAAAADIALLADIQDGTTATNAITTTAGISANVTTVAGISGNVTTVAGISSDVTTVAGDETDIGTVAGISANVTTVAGISSDVTTAAGISANITTVAGDSSDIQALAAKTTELGLLGTADAISDMNTLATSAIITDMDALADLNTELDALGDVTADITTVAGIEANVTTVAGISADTTTVAGISSDVTTVAGISANTTTVAGISANVTTVAGISSDVTTVAGDAADISTVAGISSDVSTVATNNANVTTVASNISGVNSFADRYRVGSSDPTTSLDEGDLFFNTTDNAYKFYDGSAWQTVNVSGIGDIVEDTTPQLGGNLDTNGNDINFGDNDKAIFGAGSDLRIWHDGSNSYVSDDGTGVLNIQSNGTQINLQKADGTKMIEAINNGNVVLYSNGTERIRTNGTGVDVTGTVTADDLKAISNTPTVQLLSPNSSNGYQLLANVSDAVDGGISIQDVSESNAKRFNIDNNGDISFYDSTGVTQGFYWDASTQRLGLGTTSPSTLMHLSASSPRITLTDTDTGADHRINADSGAGNLAFDVDVNSDTASPSAVFNIKGTERMRISNTGIVTKPAQPSFRAVSTGSWTIPTSTQTIFPANSAVFNIGSGYNTGTYKFTAPVDGVYYFYGQWFGSVGSNRAIASIYKNDAQTGGSQSLYLGSTNGGGISYATQSMMQLDAGDTASFYTYQESGSTVTANQSSHLSFWYGYLLG